MFNTPIMFSSLVFTIFRAFRTGRELLFNHALVVGVFWVFKISSPLSHTLGYFNVDLPGLKEVAIVSGCLAGLAITLARLANKRLAPELYSKLCLQKSSAKFTKTHTRVTGKNYLRMPLDSSFLDELDESSKGFYYSDIYDSITVCVILT